jgi:hypothetical protein
MPAVQVPWQNVADFQFEVALDRFVYLVRLRWNDYAKAWGMDLMTRSKTRIIMGTKLTLNTDLLRGSVMPFAPPGAMFVLGAEPTFTSFYDGASSLVYLDAEAISAL